MSRPPLRPAGLVAVALGGAMGALLRWAIGEWAPDGAGFPWTTLAINVVGSGLLGLLPALDYVRHHWTLPLFLGTGVLGGFTTLSAWSVQTRELLASGQEVTALLYVAATLLACLSVVALARRASTPSEQLEFEDEEGNE